MSTPVSLQRDMNFVAVAGGVLDDGSGTIAPLSIQASTGRLKVTAIGISGGSTYQVPLSGGLTGTNTWTTAPTIIFVDGVSLQKVRTDGTENWTGTTTTVLTITPTYDIFSLAGSNIPSLISGNLGQSTFIFSSAPEVLSVDGIPMQQTRTDGTENWTGTTTIVLTISAQYDIFAIA